MKTPKQQALEFRKKGYSYTYIHEKTKLSKSTLSHLLRSVPYTPNAFTKKTIGSARVQSGVHKANSKRQSIATARKRAVEDIGQLSHRDLFMLGIGIYIGEGSKTQNIVRVVNADARVICLFIKWLTSLGYDINNLAIRIHLYQDSDVVAAETYWAKQTGLKSAQFQKACIDTRQQKNRKRSGTHLYGTAHVTVRAVGNKQFGVGFSRLIGAWMEKVLE